jgi:inner membrane transporter RhtA
MSAAESSLTRAAALKATGLVVVGSLGIQLSSAICASLFPALGPAAVASLRMAIAAVVLWALLRPRLRGRSRASWAGVVVYGVAMAAMNLSLYAAVERLPLGVAVTLDFLGPCAVALLASRRLHEGLCALLALGGVVLISGPSGHFDLLGYAFGLSAAFFFALYTVFAERVGKDEHGLSSLALSVAVAALVLLPFGAPRVPEVTGEQWGTLAVAAVVGVVLSFTADTLAASFADARVVGTLFSADPVLGSLVGAVVMGERIGLLAWTGILLVSAAGALLVWSSGRRPAKEERVAP